MSSCCFFFSFWLHLCLFWFVFLPKRVYLYDNKIVARSPNPMSFLKLPKPDKMTVYFIRTLEKFQCQFLLGCSGSYGYHWTNHSGQNHEIHWNTFFARCGNVPNPKPFGNHCEWSIINIEELQCNGE